MKKQSIYINEYDWSLVAFFDVFPSDFRHIEKCLDIAGCDDASVLRIYNNVVLDKLACGMTYSNLNNRASVVVICHSKNESEFVNTWLHELIHVSVHIATAYDIDYRSEDMAYIGGNIAGLMQPVVSEFMCNKCHSYHESEKN